MKNQALVTLAACSALLIGGATHSLAYSKFEHEQLTYYAFKLAKIWQCETSGSRPKGCDGFDLVPPTELGKVTRAVDYFSNPGRLAPVAAACQGNKESRARRGGCRDTVVTECENLDEAACLDFAAQHTRAKVLERRDKRLFRALALHRNDEHFREGAEREYNRMHGRAIQFAHEGRLVLALVAEAVAVHFLQDGFSPGHLAAPRDQYGDSHAGALHDRANSRGLLMWVDREVCEVAEDLVEPLESLMSRDRAEEFKRDFALITQAKRPGKRIAVAKQITAVEVAKNLCDFTQELCAADSGYYRAFGDKRLLAGMTAAPGNAGSLVSQSSHRISLLAVSVSSIKDVLNADLEGKRLRACFHPPSQLSKDYQTVPSDRFWAPGFAVGRRVAAWPPEEFCWKEEQPGLIFGYQTAPVANPPIPPEIEGISFAKTPASSRYDLRAGTLRVNSLQGAISYWGDERRRFELGYDAISTEKYSVRTDHELLPSVMGRKAVVTAGGVLHFEEDKQLEVLGLGLLVTSGTQFKDWDVYAAIEPGLGHYRYPGGSTTAYRWSARVGVGFSLFALEGIVERGLEVTPTGTLSKEWRPSVNLRFRLAPSWLALPFQKLGSGRKGH